MKARRILDPYRVELSNGAAQKRQQEVSLEGRESRMLDMGLHREGFYPGYGGLRAL